jgi:hypothetical protein
MASISSADCVQALQIASDRLGEWPSKAQYESLDLTPSSATIVRTMGGWNAAKSAAGLETSASRGNRVQQKSESVTLPEDTTWAALSVDQRWHYKHRDQNAKQTFHRRAKLRAWISGIKRERGCRRCTETDSACLDFHHPESGEKTASISAMVSNGRSVSAIRTEMERCTVLCANCHRKEHAEYRFERIGISPDAMVEAFGTVDFDDEK